MHSIKYSWAIASLQLTTCSRTPFKTTWKQIGNRHILNFSTGSGLHKFQKYTKSIGSSFSETIREKSTFRAKPLEATTDFPTKSFLFYLRVF